MTVYFGCHEGKHFGGPIAKAYMPNQMKWLGVKILEHPKMLKWTILNRTNIAESNWYPILDSQINQDALNFNPCCFLTG